MRITRSMQMLLPWMVLFCVELKAQEPPSSLTPAQRLEVEAMIAKGRAEERFEVKRELCSDLASLKIVLPSCASEAGQPSPAEVAISGSTSSQTQRAADNAGGATFSSGAFFGTSPAGTIDSNVDRAGDSNRFVLSASDGSSRASFRATRTVSKTQTKQDGTDVDSRGKEGGKWRSFSTYSATFSAPLEKGGKPTSLATLDGFANSSELALRYSKLLVQTGSGARDAEGELSRYAKSLYERTGLDPDKHYDLDKIKEQLTLQGMEDQYPYFRALYWNPNSRRYVYGAFARIGDETYKYIQPGTTTETSNHERPASVGMFGGIVPAINKDTFFGAGLEYQKAFEPSKVRTVCPTAEPDTDVVECVSGPYGSPKESDRLLLSLEARRAFGSMGALIKVTHDLRNSNTGVDVPLFLFNDPQTGFSTGVRLGWSNTDQFSLGVFFDAAFQLEGTK